MSSINRKQRRLAQSHDKSQALVHLFDKSYTLEEAGALSIQQHSLGNLKTAIYIYNVILSKVPNNPGIYNNRGVALQEMGRHDEALASCEKAIVIKSDYVNAHYNRGNILRELKRHNDALASYDKVVALNPDYAEAYTNRGIALQKMHRYEEALVSCDKAIALKPDYAEAHYNRGNILQAMKRYDEALASYYKALTLKPADAETYHNLGDTLASKGDLPGAERMFLRALELKPNFPNSLLSLTSIRKYDDVNHDDIKKIKLLLNNPDTSSGDKEYLCFSLGKIYDDCGLYDEAFEYYRQANQLCNAATSYNRDVVSKFANDIIEVFGKGFLAQSFSFASDSEQPLFIVGMPRSGTTLMTSILSNHPAIGTAGELATITESTVRLPWLCKNIPYPQAVKHVTTEAGTCLINDYAKRLERDLYSDTRHIIDKHPLNFWHLGLISMLFPKARIIHCTRDPMDTCLSNYFQRFFLSYDYSFDLKNIGYYYNEYAKIMEHWRKVLPMQMIEVGYEDMILNTEQMARKTLDLLGMEWDERCLSPHTNICAVETASKWQVRQPIYKQSVERWRHYEKYLQPLKKILGVET